MLHVLTSFGGGWGSERPEHPLAVLADLQFQVGSPMSDGQMGEGSDQDSTSLGMDVNVLETRFQIVNASEHPQICQSGRTPLTVPSTGRLLAFEDTDPESKAGGLVAVGVIVDLINVTFTSVLFVLWCISGKCNKRMPKCSRKIEEEFDTEDYDLETRVNLTPIQELQESDNDDEKLCAKNSIMSSKMSKDTSVTFDKEGEEADCDAKDLEDGKSVNQNKTYLLPDISASPKLEADTKTPIKRTNSSLSRADAHAMEEHDAKMSIRRSASANTKRNESSASIQSKEMKKGSARESRRQKPLVVPCMYVDNRKSRLNKSEVRYNVLGLDHGHDSDNSLDENIESKPALTKSLSMKSDEQRKNVQFDEDQNISIEVYYKIPEWQIQWESFRDPFSCTSSVNDGASSMRSVSTLLSIPDFAWADPETDERKSLTEMWHKVNRLFPGISKKHFREAYYEDGLLNVRRSFDERHQSECEIKNLPIYNNRRRPSKMYNAKPCT